MESGDLPLASLVKGLVIPRHLWLSAAQAELGLTASGQSTKIQTTELAVGREAR